MTISIFLSPPVSTLFTTGRLTRRYACARIPVSFDLKPPLAFFLARTAPPEPDEPSQNTEGSMPTDRKIMLSPRSRTWDRSSASCFAISLCLAVLTLGAHSAAQTVTDLYDFTGNAGDGYEPSAPMIADSNRVLYGTTLYGGLLSCAGGSGIGCGTVFQLTPQGNGMWSHSTIYEFTGGKDGYDSYSTLTLDSAGRLYGVTDAGNPGGVFQLSPPQKGKKWHFALLYEFKNQSDGLYPQSPMFLDNSGAIYGVTVAGNLSGRGCNQQFGCGSVFQLVPPAKHGGNWTKNNLYQFQGASDGGNPSTTMMDRAGIIYGTTMGGGTFNKNCPLGCGVIFRLAPKNGNWTYSVLHSFKGAPDQIPYGSLVQDASGNLYGLVTRNNGGGDIFQLTPPADRAATWNLTYIHHYVNQYPASNLALGEAGVLYGDIYGDQDLDYGYIFRMTPPARKGSPWTYTTLVDFNKVSVGVNPAGVVIGEFGNIYATMSGGTYAPGNLMSVVP
jgi:uncharacterized repeat protein (TIGR03803 family)